MRTWPPFSPRSRGLWGWLAGAATVLVAVSVLVSRDDRNVPVTAHPPRAHAPRNVHMVNYFPSDRAGSAMWTEYDGPEYEHDLELAKGLGFDTIRTPIAVDDKAFDFPRPTVDQLARLVDFYKRIQALGLKWRLVLFDQWGLYGRIADSETFIEQVLAALPNSTAIEAIEIQNETPFSSTAPYPGSFGGGWPDRLAHPTAIGATALVWAKQIVPFVRTLAPALPVVMSSRGIGRTSSGITDLATYYAAVHDTVAAPSWYEWHAYSADGLPATVYHGLRAAIAAVGGDPAALFIGETGRSSVPTGDEGVDQALSQQKAYLLSVRMSCRDLGLNDPAPWTLFDITGGNGNWANGQSFGLLDATGQLKPAGQLYKQWPSGAALPPTRR